MAATWNSSLSKRFGEVLGAEARHRGKDVILGPGVNIIRTPLCGRNFEYMSEDPCLIQKMGPNLVVGTNANTKHGGGGSSGVRALYEITPLEGIKNYRTEKRLNFHLVG